MPQFWISAGIVIFGSLFSKILVKKLAMDQSEARRLVFLVFWNGTFYILNFLWVVLKRTYEFWFILCFGFATTNGDHFG